MTRFRVRRETCLRSAPANVGEFDDREKAARAAFEDALERRTNELYSVSRPDGSGLMLIGLVDAGNERNRK